MPEFAYQARNLSGDNIAGTIDAASEREAMSLLGQKQLFPIKVKAKKSNSAAGSSLFQKRVKQDVLASTLSQLADLLENGVPLLESLKILSEQAAAPRLEEAFAKIHADVSEGSSMEEAFAVHGDLFPDLLISVIRAGAEGGFLEDALRRVAIFLEQQAELKSKITGALAYPCFLGVFGGAAVFFVLIFLVPMFEQLFERLVSSGAGLPFITSCVLGIRAALMDYGFITLGVLVAIFLAARYFVKTEKGIRFFDYWKLKLPLVGEIFHNAAISRFCRILGTLLGNGVPLLRSLEISSSSTGNKILSEAILASAENVSSGESLSEPLDKSGLFPKTVMSIIRVAEESNSLEKVLIKVADSIDRKVERRLEIMVRLIEPIMLLIIVSIAMFILIGVLLPVFDLSSAVDVQ